jgi:hypothetical protein
MGTVHRWLGRRSTVKTPCTVTSSESSGGVAGKIHFGATEKKMGFSVDIGKMLFRASFNPGQKQ